MALACDRGVLALIADIANGDARVALNLLEQAASMLEGTDKREITADAMEAISGSRLIAYDKQGDNHYNVISAFIKSMRGSDPDAALHYLARMLTAGEDVKFIARRIVICAAEDVGNADPNALVVAMAAAHAVQFIGLPEGRIPLAQAVVYVATAPKSNAAYVAIDKAMSDIPAATSARCLSICGTAPSKPRDSSGVTAGTTSTPTTTRAPTRRSSTCLTNSRTWPITSRATAASRSRSPKG